MTGVGQGLRFLPATVVPLGLVPEKYLPSVPGEVAPSAASPVATAEVTQAL